MAVTPPRVAAAKTPATVNAAVLINTYATAVSRHCQSLVAVAIVLGAGSATVQAHDLERTRVTLSFEDDGSFVLDIANDPAWLLLRLESFAGGQYPRANHERP